MTDENVNPETKRLLFQRCDGSLLLSDIDALSEQFEELNLHSIASPNIQALKSIENLKRSNKSNDHRMVFSSLTDFKASETKNRGATTTYIKIDTPYKKDVLVRLRTSPEETDFMKKRVVLLKSDKMFSEDDATTLERELTEDLGVKTEEEGMEIIETSSVCGELFRAFGPLEKDIVSNMTLFSELPSHHDESRVPFLSEYCSIKKSVDISCSDDDLNSVSESLKRDLEMQDNSAPMADVAQKMESQTTVTQHSAMTIENEPHNEREERSMEVAGNTCKGKKNSKFHVGLIKNENFELTMAECVEDDDGNIFSEIECIHSCTDLNEDVTRRVSMIEYKQNDANFISQTLESANSTLNVHNTLESIKPNEEYSVTRDMDLTSKLTLSESNIATYADSDDDHSSDFESINSDFAYVGNLLNDLGEENRVHKVNKIANVERLSPSSDCRFELCFHTSHSSDSTAGSSYLEIPIMDCARNIANVSSDSSVDSTDDTTKRTQVEYQGELLKTALSVHVETFTKYNEEQLKLEMNDALKDDGNAFSGDSNVEKTDEVIFEKLRCVHQHKKVKNTLPGIDKRFPEYNEAKFKLGVKDALNEDAVIAISNSGKGGEGTDEAKTSNKLMIVETLSVEPRNIQENMPVLKYELIEATRINVVPYTGVSSDAEKVITESTHVENQDICLQPKLSLSQTELKSKGSILLNPNTSNSNLNVTKILEVEETTCETGRSVEVKTAMIKDKPLEESHISQLELGSKNTVGADSITFINELSETETFAVEEPIYMMYRSPEIEAAEVVVKPLEDRVNAAKLNSTTFISDLREKQMTDTTKNTPIKHHSNNLETVVTEVESECNQMSQVESEFKINLESGGYSSVKKIVDDIEIVHAEDKCYVDGTSLMEENFLKCSPMSQFEKSKSAVRADVVNPTNSVVKELSEIIETTNERHQSDKVEILLMEKDSGYSRISQVASKWIDATKVVDNTILETNEDIGIYFTEHPTLIEELVSLEVSFPKSKLESNGEGMNVVTLIGDSSIEDTVKITETEQVKDQHFNFETTLPRIKESSLECSLISPLELQLNNNHEDIDDFNRDFNVKDRVEITNSVCVELDNGQVKGELMQVTSPESSRMPPDLKLENVTVGNLNVEGTGKVIETINEGRQSYQFQTSLIIGNPLEFSQVPASVLGIEKDSFCTPKVKRHQSNGEGMNVVTLIGDSSIEDAVKITETEQVKDQHFNFETTLPRIEESSLECSLISPLELQLNNIHEDIDDFSRDSNIKDRVEITNLICVELDNGQVKGELMQVTSPESSRIPPDLKLENVTVGNVNIERTGKVIKTINEGRQSYQFQTSLEFSQVPASVLGIEKDPFCTPKVRRHQQSTRRESLVNELRKNLNKLLTPIRENIRRNTYNTQNVEEMIETPSFKYEVSKDPNKTRLVMEMPVSLLDLSIGSLERMSTDIPVAHPTDVEESSSEILIEKDNLIKVLEEKNNELLEENMNLKSQLKEADESNKSLKSVCQILYKNEQLLKKSIEEFENINRTLSNRYDMLREYADKKICQLNAELEEVKISAVKRKV